MTTQNAAPHPPERAVVVGAFIDYCDRVYIALETGNRVQARRLYAEAHDILTGAMLEVLRAQAYDLYGVDICYD